MFCVQVDELTLNENMCDVDGVNVAASAFEDLYESSAVSSAASGDLVYLPNNPYSPQQLFFINTAQVSTTTQSFWHRELLRPIFRQETKTSAIVYEVFA